MAENPEDLNLPASVVNRLVKDTLPQGAKVSREASAAIARSASVFVLYATSCANSVAQRHNRKTIASNDVLEALADMEFSRFVKPLQMSLESYREVQKRRKEATARRKSDKENNDDKAKRNKEEDKKVDDPDEDEEEDEEKKDADEDEEEEKKKDDEGDDDEEKKEDDETSDQDEDADMIESSV